MNSEAEIYFTYVKEILCQSFTIEIFQNFKFVSKMPMKYSIRNNLTDNKICQDLTN